MAKSQKEVMESRPMTKRVPISGKRDLLTIEDGYKEAGYVYRWMNDTNNRIYRAKMGGYEHVSGNIPVGQPTADTPSNVGAVVSRPVGSGVTSFLMRIRQEFYEEDQKNKQQEIDEHERAMGKLGKEAGMYGNLSIGNKELS